MKLAHYRCVATSQLKLVLPERYTEAEVFFG
jgi:hypothetical protein